MTRVYKTGPEHHNFKGEYVNHAGYKMLWVGHIHPMADCRGHCMEHRLVMAYALGRMLRKEEVVYHINKDRADNRIENLRLHSSQSEHTIEHADRPRDELGRYV